MRDYILGSSLRASMLLPAAQWLYAPTEVSISELKKTTVKILELFTYMHECGYQLLEQEEQLDQKQWKKLLETSFAIFKEMPDHVLVQHLWSRVIECSFQNLQHLSSISTAEEIEEMVRFKRELLQYWEQEKYLHELSGSFERIERDLRWRDGLLHGILLLDAYLMSSRPVRTAIGIT